MQWLIWPVLIICNVVLILCAVHSYTGWDIPYTVALFDVLGLDVKGDGKMMSIYISLFLVLILVLLIVSWIGSFRWKKRTPLCWSLAMILTMAGCIYSYFSLYTSGQYVLVSKYLNDTLDWNLKANLFLVLLAALIGLMVVFTVLNLMYFFQRRKLFGTQKESAPEPEPVPAPETVSAEPETVPEESSPETDEKKYCPHCGAELGPYDDTFCTHCGYKLK